MKSVRMSLLPNCCAHTAKVEDVAGNRNELHNMGGFWL